MEMEDDVTRHESHYARAGSIATAMHDFGQRFGDIVNMGTFAPRGLRSAKP